MLALELILWMIIVYLACGLVFAIPFVLKGVEEIDEGARGATWGFKLIIIPATTVFWPLLLRKWIREKKRTPMQELHEQT
jgi:hypothetical protein